MKHLCALTSLLFTLSATAQEVRTAPQPQPPAAPKYASDAIIDNQPLIDQRRVRIATAYNGFIYAAFTTVDNGAQSGGITIRKSIDGGATWTTFDSYAVPFTSYPVFDLVVTGSTPADLVVTLVGVNRNLGNGNDVLYIDRYDGISNGYLGSTYNRNFGLDDIMDVALASDHLFPAVGSAPFSIGLLYTRRMAASDSVAFIGSLDGGLTWPVYEGVMNTGQYCRGVSLAYGRSNSGSNGRYFGAWETLNGSNFRTGNIYTSRSASLVDGPWIAPVNLDSVSTTMIGLCRDPQIAVSQATNDNDSSSLTAVVLVGRDFTGDGSDHDLLGLYNMRAHFTSFWYRLDVSNNGENEMQPDVSFDHVNQNFLATYFDSTNKQLPLLDQPLNMPDPNNWNLRAGQYNDNVAGDTLIRAWPRVEYDAFEDKAVNAWTDGNILGRARFDAENLITAVPLAEAPAMELLVQPTVADDQATVVHTDAPAGGQLELIDARGAVVLRAPADANGRTQLAVHQLPSGRYTVRFGTRGGAMATTPLVVVH